MHVNPDDRVGRKEIFVGGKWRCPAEGQFLDVINPASEGIIGCIGAATAADVPFVMETATEAFKTWGKTTGAHRAAILRKVAEGVRVRRGELATTESLDMGKPIDEAEWDMDDVATCFDYYAGLAEKLDAAQETPVELPDSRFATVIRREPLGVVLAITPWNYPLLMATWKVAPALAAGCCVVLKPSELASLSCQLLCDIASTAGVPPGALTLVTGLGPDIGGPLTTHPGFSKIAFTGSLATGKRVMHAAADNVVPVSLELGGKSPLVVFDDGTDVAQIVEWVMFGCFWTNGQICSATSRLLVQDTLAGRLLALLQHHCEQVKICDPLVRECRLGPVVSQAQYDKIQGHISTAVEEGATVLTGGKRPAGLSKGYFIEPTVITGVTREHSLWRNEVFGPVLAVSTFRTEDDAVAMANDCEFGLGAAVISADPERCKRLTDAFQAGIVWVNCSQPCFCHAPWGGMKRSGFGRELGQYGLDNFLHVKQKERDLLPQVTKWIANEQFGWYPSFAKPKM